MNTPQKTPLVDLLRVIPADYRAEWPSQWGEGDRAIGHTMSPVGRLMHEAADEIDRLTKQAANMREPVGDSEQQYKEFAKWCRENPHLGGERPMKTTEIFIDCEWNGYGGQLISMALVGLDGRELYLATPLREELDPWVADNVMPGLGNPTEVANMLAFSWAIETFLAPYISIEVIADWPEDIEWFCRAMIVGPGERIDTPVLCMRVDRCLDSDDSAILHNALEDARSIRSMWLSMKAFEGRAKRAGFHDFKVADNGCYADVFLQHFYYGWESAFDSCSEITNNSEPVGTLPALKALQAKCDALSAENDRLDDALSTDIEVSVAALQAPGLLRG